MTTIYYVDNYESESNDFFATRAELDAYIKELIEENDGDEQLVLMYHDFYEMDVPFSIGEPLTMPMMLKLLKGVDFKIRAIK